MRRALLSILILLSACTHPASSVREVVAKDRDGRYLTLDNAIQGYLGGDDHYLEITWNIAEGYRLYTEATTISDSSGALTCQWNGSLAKEYSPRYGLITTARILATTKCARPMVGAPIPTLLIKYVGGSIDGRTFPPGEMRLTPDGVAPFYSGVVIQDLSKELMGLEPAFSYGGALVYATIRGSDAERSGLLRGDIVTAINDIPVRSASQFVIQIQRGSPDQPDVELDVYRLSRSFKPKRIRLKRDLNVGQSTTVDESMYSHNSPAKSAR